MSRGEDYTGPWNEGKTSEMGEEWQYIDDPHQHVLATNGLLEEEIKGTERNENTVQAGNKALSADRKATIDEATQPVDGILSWSEYNSEMTDEKAATKPIGDKTKQKKSKK
jgi:Mn-containing catalase